MSETEDKAGMDAFVADLRRHFLSDPEEQLPGMVEDLEGASSLDLAAFGERVNSFMRRCHSLKGGSQMVGFAGLAEFLHELETVAREIVEKRADQASVPQAAAMLQTGYAELEAYMQSLKTAEGSDDPYAGRWKPALRMISDWVAEAPSPAPLAATEVATQASSEGEGSSFGFFEEDAASPNVAEASPKESEPAGFGFFEDEPTHNDSPAPAQPATTPKASAVARTTEYLLCENRGQRYAMPVKHVREVVASGPLSPIPYSSPIMAGVIRLRDEFIPVVKRHAVFGMRDRAAAADGGKNGNAAALRDCIVICEMEGKKFGLPMEQVRQVVEFEEGRLQAVNRLGEPSETLIRQVGTWDGASVLFLDLDQLSIPDSSASQPRP